MAKILYRTKGNVDPKGKPRVYFTCHALDREGFFDKICDDIFMTHDCAIYYKENMDDAVADDDLETTLGRMNLFVVPVTRQLLTTPNTAIDRDLPYAAGEDIPILPIMMESGLDGLYSHTEIFGERQYINPFSEDSTEISYGEKLKRYLQSVLIGDETVKRIRAAFDAYVFLSYRKKDRKYANELMKLIHRHSEFRDIAIWYDEFLVPGESFKENIKKILDKSDLYALLVAPNLLEEPNGAPNFVMAEEYPYAKDAGMDILPAEMDVTDRAALEAKFDGIPDCVDPREEKAFYDRLLESLLKVAKTASNDSPEHAFLIGLAYFEGIDVEVDRARGKQLIASAAESELPEAMEKLYELLARSGNAEAEKWAERLVNYYENHCGSDHEQALKWKALLANRYGLAAYTRDQSRLEKALALSKEVYEVRRKALGEDHKDTIKAQIALAFDYGALNMRQEELRHLEEAYAKRCRINGDQDSDAVDFERRLAEKYREYGHFEKARGLQEKVSLYYNVTFGETHPAALAVAHDLAYLYEALGEYEKAKEVGERVYTIRCELLGEDDPKTLTSANNLGLVYADMGDREKAVDFLSRAYDLACKRLGTNDTVTQALFYSLGYVSLSRPKAPQQEANPLDMEIIDLDLSEFVQ